MKFHKGVWLVALLVIVLGVTSLVGTGQENVISVGFRGDPGSLDPAASQPTNNTWFIWYQVYERLCKADKDNPNELVPVLATSWEANEAGDEWTFNLRKGVTFIDGSMLNADAVKYTIDRLIDINFGPAAWYTGLVELVEIVDNFTVKFYLTRPYSVFPNLLTALDGGYIVSPSSFRAHATADDPWATEWARGNVVGTGPYKITEWVHGQVIIMRRNENYWKGWDGKHFDGINFRIVREDSSRRLGIVAGSLNYAEDITFTDIPSLQADPDVNVHLNTTTQLWHIIMNNQRPPQDNAKVRQALSWAYPYDASVDLIFLGYAKRAIGPSNTGILYHNPNVLQYQEDLDKAKEVLAESGISPGDYTLELHYIAGLDFERRMAEAFQGNLAELGFKVDIKASPWPTLVQLFEQEPVKRPHMGIYYNAPDYNDPFTQTFEPIYKCGEAWNWAAHCNPEYDALLASAYQTTDPDELREIAYKLQEYLVDNAVNIYICEGLQVSATRSDIKGFYSIPFYPGIAYIYDMYRE